MHTPTKGQTKTDRLLLADKLPPVTGESIKAIQPQSLHLVFTACHSEPAQFQTFREAGKGGVKLSSNGNSVSVYSPRDLPLALRNANISGNIMEDWLREDTQNPLVLLDELTWDIIVAILTAFYQRTSGMRAGDRFIFQVADLYNWRGIDVRNRSAKLQTEIIKRIELLFQVFLHTEGTLYLTNPKTGRKQKTSVVAKGPFLVEAERYYAKTDSEQPVAFRISLGEWARDYVEECAMLGIYPRILAQYDLRRQRWARLIGWYVLFQMNAQASRMRFRENEDGLVATPQQPLLLSTVLNNSCVAWQEMARTDPSKVITQFLKAVEQLCDDGILSDCRCMDGPEDGSDLPRKGRLTTMLKRRYLFFPGGKIIDHLHAKSGAASRATARVKKAHDHKGGQTQLGL